MLRFTTRDLLWLTALVAVNLGWLLSAHQQRVRRWQLRERIDLLEAEAEELRNQWDAAGAEMEKRGIEWPPKET